MLTTILQGKLVSSPEKNSLMLRICLGQQMGDLNLSMSQFLLGLCTIWESKGKQRRGVEGEEGRKGGEKGRKEGKKEGREKRETWR